MSRGPGQDFKRAIILNQQRKEGELSPTMRRSIRAAASHAAVTMAVTPSSADEENDSSESASSVDEKEAIVITSVQNDVDKENVPTLQYSGWSLKQLKEECKAMALPCSGTKDTLIGRLEGRILAKPTGRRKGGIKENTIPSMSAADTFCWTAKFF